MKGPRILIWGFGAVMLLALGIALTRPAAATRADISNAELRELAGKGARLVDVRSPGEYAMGHIEGAENVPVEQITSAAGSWDKSVPVIVYCATGARSMNAAQFLAANGFTKVYNLKAGVVAWDQELTKDNAVAAGPIKTDGKPIFIDFYSDS